MATLFCCFSPTATHSRLPSAADRSPGLSLIFSCDFNTPPPATTIHRPRLVVKASRKDQIKKSIVCTDCSGNGAIQCKQCKGTGVNSVDHFNGQFKAGALCWLCRGKREILCGNCNGAGFLGGFMSTQDE